MIYVSAGIYKITSPSNNVYIGQSRNIKRRWSEHFHKCKVIKTVLQRSFIKYGVVEHKFEMVQELPFDISQKEMDSYEQSYIDFYKFLGFTLLNSKEAGCYGKHTDETKEKLRLLNTGKKLSDETKLKIGLKSKGNKHRLGQKVSMETMIKKSKPVLQYSKSGEFVCEFISAIEAQRKTGIFQTNISENCRGKRKSAGGFIWKFK